MADKEKCKSSINKLAVALAVVIVYNLLLTAVVGYAGFYAINRFHKLEETNDILQQEVELLKSAQREVQKEENSGIRISNRDKREVISSSGEFPDFNNHQGSQSTGESDAGDSSSLAAIKGMINVTVEKISLKEWTKFSSTLPTYGGATYVRWGRTVCPASSKLIYKGQMAGPDHRSAGGGTNYQCLPEDPEYENGVDLDAIWSDLVYTTYTYYKGPFNQHIVPCAVCETEKRVTKLMIPAKTRCPTEDWVLEYKGYLYSSASQHASGEVVKGFHYRNTYACVDSNEESLTGNQRQDMGNSDRGAILHRVKARCSGDAALYNCPPYQSDKPLSCVVCSK